ncbi:hypothetical protein FRB94_009744 [Tulasnella sp. JGI-2019a]|nr:hypothetical protein FRB94_009744 [Tulasnella sp. JGI-2019a]
MSSVTFNPTPTAVSASSTSTNSIPNLHGGAHPATPKLAGIICGSCVLFAWTICLLYWYRGHRKEVQDLKEMEANEKADGEYSRRRAAADRLERIESAERKERERHQQKVEKKRIEKVLAKAELPLMADSAPAAGHSSAVGDTHHHHHHHLPGEKETQFGTSEGPPNSIERAGGHTEDWEGHKLSPMLEVPIRDEK